MINATSNGLRMRYLQVCVLEIRIRRVKCDEEKPHCRRCLSTHRKCDGYLPASSKLSRRDLQALAEQTSLGPHLAASRSPTQAPASLSDPLGGEARSSPQSRECQLFDLFRSTTAPATAVLVPSHFWTSEILQLAHAEPAVWHAVVALGGLHCRWHSETTAAAAGDVAVLLLPAGEVELHYHQAVSLARDMRHPERALALSLALGAAANLMGLLRESRMHVAAGRRLLCELGRTDEVAHAAEIVARLDLEAMSFGEATAPYELQDAAVLRYDPGNSLVIRSYEHATSDLFRMLRILMMADEEIPTLSIDLASENGFEKDLRAWEAAMAAFEESARLSTEMAEGSGIIPALSVRLHHALVRVFIIASIPGPETRFDAHLALFSRLLALAKILAGKLASCIQAMTMEPGLVMALFMVGSRCRHPQIRWECVRLLDNLNRQEGLWRSDAIAVALRRVIEVEEEEMGLHAGKHESPASSLGLKRSPRSESSSGAGDTNGPGVDYDNDKLLEIMGVRWTAWAQPGFKLQSDETWDGVPLMPESCRVRGFLPTISVAERSIAATLFLSQEEVEGEQSTPRIRQERCWF